MNRKFLFAASAIALLLAGCANDADIASHNLSQAADNFQINRRIIFINLWTGKYELVIEGLCSQEDTGDKLAVTCKTGPNTYKKHFLGRSANLSYVSEQIEASSVSPYHYSITFKPSAIMPDILVK